MNVEEGFGALKSVKESTVPGQRSFDGIAFPLVLSPAGCSEAESAGFWNDWVEEHLETIENLLLRHGAILFRNFPFDTAVEFDKFAKSFGYKERTLLEGVIIRKPRFSNIVTTTEAPSGALISFHHELSQRIDHPTDLFFYCEIPAKEGGETPIALSSVIYRRMAELEPELVERMEREHLRYVTAIPPHDMPHLIAGRSWRFFFEVDDEEEAEQKARAKGYDVEWLADGWMKVITPGCPGIRYDRRTGQKIWFNLIEASTNSWRETQGCGETTVAAAVFPNGDAVSGRAFDAVRRVAEESAVYFQWQRKDVLLVDNRTVEHKRAKYFVPPRSHLISLYDDKHGPLSACE